MTPACTRIISAPSQVRGFVQVEQRFGLPKPMTLRLRIE